MKLTNIPSSGRKLDWGILYYIILGIIQSLWTNLSAFPPMHFRLVMLLLVFIPMFIKKEMVVFGIPFFMILRGQLATDYQYLPDIHSYMFYIPLLVILLFIHCRKISVKHLYVFIPISILIVYMWIIDILATSECGVYVINLFIAYIYSFFLSTQRDSNILATSLLSVCAILSVYYILMYDQFLETWNATEGIERSGWIDPNYFSTLFGVGFLIAILSLLGYVEPSFRFFNKYALVIISILIFLAVVLTASRAGFLATSIILLFTIIKSRMRFSTFLLSLFFIIVTVTVMFNMGVFDTLLFRFFEQGNMATGGDRTTIWLRVIENHQVQPWFNQIFGGGYWNRAELSGGEESHNEFIALWADYGYVGLILFLFLLMMMVSNGNSRNLRIITTCFYCLTIVTLSQFQYVNIGFFIVWVLSLKLTSNNLATHR